MDIATLTAYVSYARKHIQPQLSDEAAEELTRGYVEMRRRGNFPGSSKKVNSLTSFLHTILFFSSLGNMNVPAHILSQALVMVIPSFFLTTIPEFYSLWLGSAVLILNIRNLVYIVFGVTNYFMFILK